MLASVFLSPCMLVEYSNGTFRLQKVPTPTVSQIMLKFRGTDGQTGSFYYASFITLTKYFAHSYQQLNDNMTL